MTPINFRALIASGNLLISNFLLLNPSLALAEEAEVASPPTANIERILVTSDFRPATLIELNTSTTLIDKQTIEDEGGEHLEEMLGNISNLSWAGGSSRPKYFQIRGVGEQEEYQGAPNSSVGFIVDDIDLSGLGMAASMFDIAQIEVLRGPQGTRFGANGLAGMIYLKSMDPTDQPEFSTELSAGQDDLINYAGMASGPVNDQGTLLYRFTMQQHQQNGFRNNRYLNKDDTNQRDELTLRNKWRWFATDDLQLDLTLLYANFDNGYDAWTLDNNGFSTITDQPGKDTQETSGAAVNLNWSLNQYVDLVSITSAAHTNHRHAYDGDWANPDYWSSRHCTDYYDENGNGDVTEQLPCQYQYLWDKRGERDNYSQQIRFLSTEKSKIFSNSTHWLFGLYIQRLEEDNDLNSEYNGAPDLLLNSHYNATSIAGFAQFDSELTSRLALSVGGRIEQRNSDYTDSNGESFSPDENMWGGHIALNYRLNEAWQGYSKLARGYKAGGFNMGLPNNFNQYRQFDNETLDNFELGFQGRWPHLAATIRGALFYMWRNDQQVATSIQDPENPQRFLLFTDNATSSDTYGAELEGKWQANRSLLLYGSLGLLNAEFNQYQIAEADGTMLDLSGRDLAHAPNYQFSLGTTWRADLGWFINLNMSGSDSYFYSDNHNQRSQRSRIFNARLGYEADAWSLTLWGRNINDEKYGVRGFYFGNEPDNDWTPKLYERFGDPQQFGITFRYHYL